MDEFNNNSELEGFDKVEPANTQNNPYDPIYSKPRQEIIQDEPIKNDFSDYTPNFVYTPPKPKKEKKGYGVGAIVLSAILAAIIGAASSFGILYAYILDNSVVEIPDATTNNVNINIEETVESVVEAVATKCTNSVVGIKTTTSVMSFFGGTSESSGEGSGVIYSADGYIITNYHVIGDAVTNKSGSKIEVFIESASSDPYAATVVGYNISADLAIIKINAKNLTPVTFADSKNLKVGQYVITIGNPGGLEFMGSVTYGVISGLDRVVSSDSNIQLIQTDAAINPGNSGGALLNTKGELVGINSSKIVADAYEGMGFAIPSNTVSDLCKKIIEKENSPEPYIGVTVSERYTAEVLKSYGYPVGAVVLSVAEGSPAYNAGIKKGDIITEFGGKEITEFNVLEQLLNKSTPEENVNIKIYRNGRYYSATITIGSNNQVE
ncbi:MAG: trypsin-like peptidase domain-containing protein [Clostridia bacterium]|nr:trypsin-like peptidase domain-containing protein [Clostridia bacterium]